MPHLKQAILGITGSIEPMSECDSPLALLAQITLRHRDLPCLAQALLETKAAITQAVNPLGLLFLYAPTQVGQPLAPALPNS